MIDMEDSKRMVRRNGTLACWMRIAPDTSYKSMDDLVLEKEKTQTSRRVYVMSLLTIYFTSYQSQNAYRSCISRQDAEDSRQ
jgi:hypothetical protein